MQISKFFSGKGVLCAVTLHPLAPTHVNFLLTMSLLTPAGDQLVVRGGNAHFLPPQEYDRGNGENRRTNEQTRTKLGVNQEQRKVCNTLHSWSIYGLTLAWVTSENSTKLLESDSSWLTVAGPYPMLPRLSAPVSGIDCPCPWFHANSPLLASLLSNANCSRPGPPSTALSSFVQPTLIRVPFPLPDTARFHVQESFVWFRAKTDKGIVCFGGPPT